MSDIPIIEQLPTTWKVSFPDDTEKEFGSLKPAIEACFLYSDTITFIPWARPERANYTWSIEKDSLYKTRI